MRWHARHGGWLFEDAYALYIRGPNGEGYDYLQDTLEIAQWQAMDDFGVPMDAWQHITERTQDK